MDHMPLLSLLLYSFPESLILFSYGFVLMGRNFKKNPIILASIISVLLSYLVRGLPIPFGVHTLIGVLIICILFIVICKFPVKQGIIASLAGLATLTALENIILYLIQVATGWSIPDMLAKGAWVRSFIGYPQLMAWVLLTYFLYKRKLTLVGGERIFVGDEK